MDEDVALARLAGEREAPFREDTALSRCRTRVSVVNPIRWLSRALPCLAILVIAGCDMDMQKEPRTPAPPPPPEPEVCAGQPVATRQDWTYGVDSTGNEELDFTSYERDALDRLHAEGWNGNGVQMVVYDFFPEDGSPGHGTGVANVARYYAPNAIFTHRDTRDERGYDPDGDLARLHIVNASVAIPNLKGQDRLPIDQAAAVRDTSTYGHYGALFVWGAGNANMALPGDDPANAIPAMRANRFVGGVFADRGWLHAKSAAVVAGAVDYRAADDGWVLSHDSRGYSARAGAARHAFIVAPDDNRPASFAGTSFATPRVSGALAILAQKCPTLTSEQLTFILLMSARDLGDPGVDEIYGHGLIDLERAMARAKEPAATYDDYDSTIPKDDG